MKLGMRKLICFGPTYNSGTAVLHVHPDEFNSREGSVPPLAK
jgi:hypothetical protein